MAGTFITFEGIDGSGKSTQLRLVSNFLREHGCETLLTREPGGTTIGSRLRAALLDADEEVDPLTELLVFAADRAQHVRRVLRPALAAAREAGLVSTADAAVLEAAWTLAARVRNALTLVRGRPSDQMPRQGPELEGVARLLAHDGDPALVLERYLRTTRRARAVYERLFAP